MIFVGNGCVKRIYVILCFVLLLLGSTVRLMSGTPLLFTRLVYASGKRARSPGTRTPEDTVKSFYLYIDSGEYERAYGVILEPDWRVTPDRVSYNEEIIPRSDGFQRWTGEDEFVQRSIFEIGRGGTGITLNSLEAVIVEELNPQAYGERFRLRDLTAAYRVEVSGNILGACSIFSWRNELVVLQVDSGYRVLLSGTKRSGSFYHHSWFSGYKRIGTIRAGGGS
jgi:hypothetical protein